MNKFDDLIDTRGGPRKTSIMPKLSAMTLYLSWFQYVHSYDNYLSRIRSLRSSSSSFICYVCGYPEGIVDRGKHRRAGSMASIVISGGRVKKQLNDEIVRTLRSEKRARLFLGHCLWDYLYYPYIHLLINRRVRLQFLQGIIDTILKEIIYTWKIR